jgi:protein-disulfide isomerase
MKIQHKTTMPALLLAVLTLLSSAGSAAQTSADGLTSHQGIPVGFTEEGHPFLGDPNAPVTLEEWSDYLCPFCGRHFHATLPELLDKYVRPGQMKLVFRDFPIAGLHPTAARGHEAALCAGDQGAAAYWNMHDALFARQAEWNRLPDPSMFLATVAGKIGIDMDAWQDCLAEGKKAAVVAESVKQAQALGYNGTPSFRFVSTNSERAHNLVGAQPIARFARLADPLIAGQEPPEEPKPEPPELPSWAKPEGLTPDPARPGYNTAGDAYRGDPEARLVVIEFNDFQCPACRRHALEYQPLIDEKLVDTGQVLWVNKHFPLRVHPYAALAAVAAECAGDQGKFWDMHHLLFDQTDEWANEEAETKLLSLGQELSLDMPQFTACFNGRHGLERVLQDLYDAQGIVESTPTFVIIQDGRGALMRDPPSADQFIGVLTKRLEATQGSSADNTMKSPARDPG